MNQYMIVIAQHERETPCIAQVLGLRPNLDANVLTR
jgi:hypothetical protein